MSVNQDLLKMFVENKALLMVFDVNCLYPSAVVDNGSYYPGIQTRYLFTQNGEGDVIHQFINETVTQFKDQASAILRICCFNPENLTFQHLCIKEDITLHAKKNKNVDRLRKR